MTILENTETGKPSDMRMTHITNHTDKKGGGLMHGKTQMCSSKSKRLQEIPPLRGPE